MPPAGTPSALHVPRDAGRVLLFHHEPSRTDDAIDEIVASFSGAGLRVDAAAEGMIIDLPRRD